MDSEIKKRFWDKVDKGERNECWEWTAATTKCGYGHMKVGDSYPRAHRLSYKMEYGGIDEEFVLHECDNPPCVNPSHLYAGNNSDNMQDASNRDRFERKGEDNPQSTLTEEDVLEIRERAKSEVHSKIAKEFGISSGHMSMIVNRNIWCHV